MKEFSKYQVNQVLLETSIKLFNYKEALITQQAVLKKNKIRILNSLFKEIVT